MFPRNDLSREVTNKRFESDLHLLTGLGDTPELPSELEPLKANSRFGKTIVISNLERIALHRENAGLRSSKNWLSKTKFEVLQADE